MLELWALDSYSKSRSTGGLGGGGERERDKRMGGNEAERTRLFHGVLRKDPERYSAVQNECSKRNGG